MVICFGGAKVSCVIVIEIWTSFDVVMCIHFQFATEIRKYKIWY